LPPRCGASRGRHPSQWDRFRQDSVSDEWAQAILSDDIHTPPERRLRLFAEGHQVRETTAGEKSDQEIEVAVRTSLSASVRAKDPHPLHSVASRDRPDLLHLGRRQRRNGAHRLTPVLYGPTPDAGPRPPECPAALSAPHSPASAPQAPRPRAPGPRTPPGSPRDPARGRPRPGKGPRHTPTSPCAPTSGAASR